MLDLCLGQVMTGPRYWRESDRSSNDCTYAMPPAKLAIRSPSVVGVEECGTAVCPELGGIVVPEPGGR